MTLEHLSKEKLVITRPLPETIWILNLGRNKLYKGIQLPKSGRETGETGMLETISKVSAQSILCAIVIYKTQNIF